VHEVPAMLIVWSSCSNIGISTECFSSLKRWNYVWMLNSTPNRANCYRTWVWIRLTSTTTPSMHWASFASSSVDSAHHKSQVIFVSSETLRIKNWCKQIAIQRLYKHCGSYLYWTVHHCDSSRIRDQLDVTSY